LRQARTGEDGAPIDPGVLEEGVAAGAELIGGWLKNRAEGQRLFPDGLLGRRRRQPREEQSTQPSVETPPTKSPTPQPTADSPQSQPPENRTSAEAPEEVTANRPSLDEPAPERRRLRIFDRRRERRAAEPEKG